jgi:excisionase family DNA binding protein
MPAGNKIKRMSTRRAFSVQEVADQLGVSRGTVHRLIATGSLRAIKLGRIFRIEATEVDALIRRGGGVV